MAWIWSWQRMREGAQVLRGSPITTLLWARANSNLPSPEFWATSSVHRAKSLCYFIESPGIALELFPPSTSAATASSALFFAEAPEPTAPAQPPRSAAPAAPHLPSQACPGPALAEERPLPRPGLLCGVSGCPSSGCQHRSGQSRCCRARSRPHPGLRRWQPRGASRR